MNFPSPPRLPTNSSSESRCIAQSVGTVSSQVSGTLGFFKTGPHSVAVSDGKPSNPSSAADGAKTGGVGSAFPGRLHNVNVGQAVVHFTNPLSLMSGSLGWISKATPRSRSIRGAFNLGNLKCRWMSPSAHDAK